MGNENKVIELKSEILKYRTYNEGYSVAYVNIAHEGLNNKGMIIPRDVLNDLAKTLPGQPVVGLYDESKEDFRGHGQQITINDDGIDMQILTKPYGFVPEIPRVWYEDIKTDDGVKSYLCTEIILWTDRYPELIDVMKGENGQSMEIEVTEFHYNKDDVLVVDEARFLGLCILGKDVTPAFPDSSIFHNVSLEDKEYLNFVESFTNDGEAGVLWADKALELYEDELEDGKELPQATYMFAAKKEESNEEKQDEAKDTIEEAEPKKTIPKKNTNTKTTTKKENDAVVDKEEENKKEEPKVEDKKEVKNVEEKSIKTDKNNWHEDPANWTLNVGHSHQVKLPENNVGKDNNIIDFYSEINALKAEIEELKKYKVMYEEKQLAEMVQEEIDKITGIVSKEDAVEMYANVTIENFAETKANVNAKLVELVAKSSLDEAISQSIKVPKSKSIVDAFSEYK